jgi:putative oxidoreductase
MFPNGWPGRGLLLLRLLAGFLLIHDGIAELIGAPRPETIFRQSVAIVAGILLFAGLWTPVAGALVVVVELWTLLLRSDHLRSLIVLAILGAALAMLGPGFWSIDARLFGRKRIDIPDR